MKKALLVTRVSGFIPQHESNNVKLLQKMGYEVHYATNLNQVVYGNDNHRLKELELITHQIDFPQSPFSPDVRIAYRQLLALLQEENFDMIHCHMPLSGVLTRLAAEKVRKQTGRNVPVLYTAHGFHFFAGAPLQNWLYYPVERYLSRYTDRLILINEEDYARGKKFPVRGTVEHIPGVGIPLEGYKPVEDKTGKARPYIEQLIGRTLSEETRVLVTIGELSKEKNHSLLIEMMEELKDLNLICIIGGTGEEEASLQAMIKEKGLEKKVYLPGYVKQVPAILGEADCFVFPSSREGLPVAMMEAMAAGLPVVAGNIRGVTDLLEHGKGGYLVNSFESVDYAVKVRRLFTEKYGKSAVPRVQRRLQMGQWNQQRVKLFSREVVGPKMQKIYESLEETNVEK
ncbi:MAG: glycosyltransferase family 4 protein [Butyribacter sp.]|nr:glycosyltransferase family 4 protein [bacterium]MDY3854458.1 glycosyltransferase family 4 protein [Butyribacter sp.]